VTERLRFVQEVARGAEPFAELCRRYGVSRRVGYQWWRRFTEEGVVGLEERSRRPKRSPEATSAQVIQLLKAERRRRPRWGPKKLLKVLATKYPELRLPAVSTAARILKREGLIRSRRRRGRPARVLPREGWGTYQASPRRYTRETPGLDYPLFYERRQVRRGGEIKWRGELVFISEVLAGEPIGLDETANGVWSVYFGPIELGRIRQGEARLRRPTPSGSTGRGRK